MYSSHFSIYLMFSAFHVIFANFYLKLIWEERGVLKSSHSI